MGYDVEISCDSVIVRASKVGAAIKAMGLLMGRVLDSHYSWVDTDAVDKALEAEDLCAALEEWRYGATAGDPMTPVEQLATGKMFTDVRVDYFHGSKLGDDELLWAALAPFIDHEASITFRGEDDTYWRYVFLDGSLIEQHGSIFWE
jgi:hypothetical protein